MKYQFIRLFIRLLALLPLSFCRALAIPIASLFRLSGSRMYRTTMTNLALCFPELSAQEQRILGQQSLQNTMQTILESGAVWLWPLQRSLALIHSIHNYELLQAASEKAKGLIILAPHLGNWELLGLYLNTCGLAQSYQLYQAPEDPRLNALIFKARSRGGAKMVATDSKGVAELLKALRKGGMAGILPDQVPPQGSGEFAPFFGQDALTMTLLIKLQQKTGAEIVMAYAKRVNDEKGVGFQLCFSAPDNDVYASDMLTALSAMNRSIERMVLEAPEQYQWEYKRFRRQPEGKPRVY